MLSDIKSNSTKVEQVDEVEGGPVMEGIGGEEKDFGRQGAS